MIDMKLNTYCLLHFYLCLFCTNCVNATVIWTQDIYYTYNKGEREVLNLFTK